jgi:hypothetical protein
MCTTPALLSLPPKSSTRGEATADAQLSCATHRPVAGPLSLLCAQQVGQALEAKPLRPAPLDARRATGGWSSRCISALPPVGTRTDYSVGPWDYPTCATWHLMAWSARTTVEEYSDRKLYMTRSMWRTLRRTRLVLSPQTDL